MTKANKYKEMTAQETVQEEKMLLAEKFNKLRPSVTAGDRLAAMTMYAKGERTIYRYLYGEIGHLEFGKVLYRFLEDRINDRAESLKELAN